MSRKKEYYNEIAIDFLKEVYGYYNDWCLDPKPVLDGQEHISFVDGDVVDDKFVITIITKRPGILIGHHGKNIDEMKKRGVEFLRCLKKKYIPDSIEINIIEYDPFYQINPNKSFDINFK